jgi:hypothetical protein
MKAVPLILVAIFGCMSSALHADVLSNPKDWSAVQREIMGASPDPTTPIEIVPIDDKLHFDRHIVRFGVQYNGYPVFYRSGAAQIDKEGNVSRIFNPIKSLHAPKANARFPSDEQITTWMNERDVEAAPPFVLGFWVDDAARLVPSIRVESAPVDPNAQVWFLNAENGRILFSEPLFETEGSLVRADSSSIDTDAPADPAVPYGAVYLQNPRVTPEVTIAALDYLDDDAVHLFGRYARAETCVDTDECKETAPVASRIDTVGNEFVFEPTADLDAPDPFAEVNSYYNITTQSDWLRNRFGWDGLFFGETWINIKVGKYWENAAYYAGNDKKPPYIVFGRTENLNFAYDSDTARHEFGHAVNDSFWDHPWSTTDVFGLDTTMTALEESIADMWALTYSDDPMLNGLPGFSRNADNTLMCPLNTLGEGHYDARYVDGFLWDLREMIGKDAFEDILYRSLSFLGNSSRYSDLVSALEQSAEALIEEGMPYIQYSSIDAIRETAKARGLLDDDCQARLVPFNDGETRYSIGYGRPRTKKMDYPFALQWKIQFPADKTGAAIFFTWLYPETDAAGETVQPGYRVHVRRGAPVEVIWLSEDERKEGEPAFDVVADATFDNSPEMVSYPYLGLSPATPGEELFVLISAESDESDLLVQADLHLIDEGFPSALPEEDTDSADFSPSSKETASVGGQSCQMSRGSSPRDASKLFSIFI